ncbi:hypothetical protein C1H46_019609 [Malus baccata]|uniref:TMV resistance protein N-like n=1 Tax=Malus baccata TaxID=106549 RepID=A0A540M7R7_MALBA|nr:hypothetical protein C1H46_019609 [Malus baccata]
MVNLEFFINHNAHFSGRVDYLPNSLRLIEFGGRLNIDQKHTYVLDLPSNFHPRHLVKFDVSYSGLRQLKEFKKLDKLTWMNLSGCEFLEKIPDLSGSPNIKYLDLSGCKNLVEVDDSVGFLDKLQVLFLSGCSKLTRFATRLGSRSLKELYLSGCTRLERFPEIEKDKMKSLIYLEIEKTGIRELPSSIAYLTGLLELHANGCELQKIPDLSGSPNIRVLELNDCTSLVEVDDSVGFLDKLELLLLNGCSKLTRFATRLGSRSLFSLSLGGCRRLESFPKIEGKMESLYLLDIEKSGIRELPSIAYFTMLRTLNEIDLRSKLNIIYPGNEVPKWFSYTSDHPTTIQPLPENKGNEEEREEEEFVGGSEFRFEIPLKLQVGETLLGLALSFVVEPSTCYSHDEPRIRYSDVQCSLINGKKTFEPNLWYYEGLKATHVSLALVGLGEQEQQGDICQIVFRLRDGCPIKSCGVHCLLRNQDELLHLSLRPTSSLGKRPRPRGSSDIVDDAYDQQQQWLSSSSEPADDHPKRRQIDPNVPFDIEEDEEQGQPSASDDLQFLIS